MKVKQFFKDMVYGYMYHRINAQCEVIYDEMRNLELKLKDNPTSETLKIIYELKCEEFENLVRNRDALARKWLN